MSEEAKKHLFDIDDIGSPPRVAGEKSPSETKEYKAVKDSKKKGFASIFRSKPTRYLKIEDNCLVVEEKNKSEVKVHSKTSLERLFQLYVEKDNATKLNLLFINAERNPALPPKIKTYKIENQDSFLEDLKKAINKLNFELRFSETDKN